ncbi:MAG: type II toxin-antitoxin system VapC family toxin [Magnetococcales bacterium]|nr:type II toxin-antitoxin system VapC family toxin [Magnetococcales bacterium]MBF0439110.1 type II toxin-antitoxin system VapC family toxin [Magnetococcales bacterium]
MGLSYILDTNAVIYLQKGVLDKALPRGNMAISVITEIELRGFPGLLTEQKRWLTDFLFNMRIIGLNDDIKETAIQLRCNHRLKIPDAIIAATALTFEATLLTNDCQLHGIAELTCHRLELRQQL